MRGDSVANTKFSTVDETNRRSLSITITMDDCMVDYMSMMGTEDKKRRFSEDVVDMDIKDSEKLKKLFRTEINKENLTFEKFCLEF